MGGGPTPRMPQPAMPPGLPAADAVSAGKKSDTPKTVHPPAARLAAAPSRRLEPRRHRPRLRLRQLYGARVGFAVGPGARGPRTGAGGEASAPSPQVLADVRDTAIFRKMPIA